MMRLQHKGLAGLAAMLFTLPGTAHAGGFERGAQDFDILFEHGNAVDTTATYVSPRRKMKNIRGSAMETATGGINPTTGRPYATSVKETGSYWVPKASAKFDLTDDLACAGQYRQPWGVQTNAGTDTVRMFSAIEQKISSNDYGLNCSYRFPAGEKGYFRILGGLSYQELKGEQSRMLAASETFGLPYRIGTLDVEDTGFGWRLGAAYEIPEYALRASLVYQSRVAYDLEGMVGNIVPGTAVAVLGEVETPQSVDFRFQTGIAPDWLVFGSVKWTDWSSIDRISFVNNSGATYVGIFRPGAEIMAFNLYFRDGWTMGGGVGHKFNDHWSAAASITWDRSTTTGLSSQSDVYMFGLGTIYKPTKQVELRLAGAAGLLTAGEINDTIVDGKASETGAQGDFGNDFVGALSLSVKVKF